MGIFVFPGKVPEGVSNKKKHEKTKCKHCGKTYEHSNDNASIIIYKYDVNAFDPKINTQFWDARQPYKCDGCGADINFNYN